MSAGEDGLFELELKDNTFHSEDELAQGYEKNIYSVDSNFSNYANYSNISIVNCNYQKNSRLILYKWYESEDYDSSKSSTSRSRHVGHRYIRRKDDIILLEEFNNKNENVIVGNLEDRIYIISSNTIKTLVFSESRIRVLSEISLNYGEPEVCFNAFFGVIIVYQQKVVILRSDGNITELNGEYSRCRVFPRSINYLNHLHCIKDNCLEIYSLMHDYFVNNNAKNYGSFYDSSKFKSHSSSKFFDEFMKL